MTGALRWRVLAAAWVATIVLGYVGWVQQGEAAGVSRSVFENAYGTLILFAVNFPLDTPNVGWALQVARFAAPLVTASTLIQAAAVVFRRQIALARLARARDHVVVCGLGEKGWRLAAALVEDHRRAAAIEIDPAAVGVAAALAAGVTVVDGDAGDPAVLRAAGVARAALVLVTCGGDADALEVAAVARRAMAPGARLAVHLTDARLCGLLRAVSLRTAGAGVGVRLELFNIYTAGARQWLASYPPFSSDNPDPVVVVVGLGQMGQALCIALAQRRAAGGEDGRLRLVVVDRMATELWRAVAYRSPAVSRHVSVECVDIDLDMPDRDQLARLDAALADEHLASVHVCVREDALAVSTALRIHVGLRGRPVPVVVRTSRAGGLATVLQRDDGTAAFAGLAPFPVVDRTCTLAALDGGPVEALAHALHNEYLAGGSTGAFAVPWQELSTEARESNRRAAEAVHGGLSAIGFDLVPSDEWDEVDPGFTDDDFALLAGREHERWRAERRATGWTYGTVRDDEAKHNPLLVPWDELSAEDRSRGLETARQLPALLARAGFEVVRTVVSGRMPA